MTSTGVYKVGFVSLVEAPRQPIYSPSTGSIDCYFPHWAVRRLSDPMEGSR